MFRNHASVINRPSGAHVSVELVAGSLLALLVQLFEILLGQAASFEVGLEAEDFLKALESFKTDVLDLGDVGSVVERSTFVQSF